MDEAEKETETKDHNQEEKETREPAFQLGGETLSVPGEIWSRLFQHQKEGVQWLLELHESEYYPGGILGDDMGLGKTFQVCSLLTCLMRHSKIQRVLILAPVSVLHNWMRELRDHVAPHVRRLAVDLVSADLSKARRQRLLADTFLSRAYRIVVSSYQLVSNMVDDFARLGTWDYVILDEGHCIKNPSTKTTRAMYQLRARHRLVLTGTPIQNHLVEFWALVDWATAGSLLGSRQEFQRRYGVPILDGQDPRASEAQRRTSREAAEELLARVRPVLLQRKKSDHERVLRLPSKVEVTVWVSPSPEQRRLYEEFLRSRQCDEALHRKTFPVEAINRLKTLCRHPFLVEAAEKNFLRRQHKQAGGGGGGALLRSSGVEDDDDVDVLVSALGGLGLDDSGSGAGIPLQAYDTEDLALKGDATVFEVAGRSPDKNELLRGSLKLRALLKLVRRLLGAGHRVLIFSQARLMLDVIARGLLERDVSAVRIDGRVTGRERQSVIDAFNAAEEGAPSVCLLTTRACGVGITLTGADRVILYDPSWNPAEDRQAVDRAYRIGQTRDIVVYRLILAGSVEEKMYEKQVFKDGVRVVTEQGQSSSRYFSRQETSELFTLGPAGRSEVLEKLWLRAGEELRSLEDTGGELPGVLGYSRHDTLYVEEGSEERGKQARRRQLLHGAGDGEAGRSVAVSEGEDRGAVGGRRGRGQPSVARGQTLLSAWLERSGGADVKIAKKKKGSNSSSGGGDIGGAGGVREEQWGVVDLTSPAREREGTRGQRTRDKAVETIVILSSDDDDGASDSASGDVGEDTHDSREEDECEWEQAGGLLSCSDDDGSDIIEIVQAEERCSRVDTTSATGMSSSTARVNRTSGSPAAVLRRLGRAARVIQDADNSGEDGEVTATGSDAALTTSEDGAVVHDSPREDLSDSLLPGLEAPLLSPTPAVIPHSARASLCSPSPQSRRASPGVSDCAPDTAPYSVSCSQVIELDMGDYLFGSPTNSNADADNCTLPQTPASGPSSRSSQQTPLQSQLLDDEEEEDSFQMSVDLVPLLAPRTPRSPFSAEAATAVDEKGTGRRERGEVSRDYLLLATPAPPTATASAQKSPCTAMRGKLAGLSYEAADIGCSTKENIRNSTTAASREVRRAGEGSTVRDDSNDSEDSGSDSEEEWDESFGTKTHSTKTGTAAGTVSGLLLTGTAAGGDSLYAASLLLRPRAALTRRQMDEYDRCVREGARLEAQGRLDDAAEAFLRCLDVCDDSAALHMRLYMLSQKLGVLP